MKLRHKGHLNTRYKFSKGVFPNPTIFLPILEEPKILGFGGTRGNP
jgi:hypothetical protein